MNMTEVSGPNRACYYLNPTTKKLELGTYDESTVMEKLQKRAEELKKNPVGQTTLTNEEIQELAKKFDPQNMTQKEYDSFIRWKAAILVCLFAISYRGFLSPCISGHRHPI